MSNGIKSDIKKINEKTVDFYPDFSGLIKHVARCRLWLPEARLLKQEKKRPLRYFTLPGKYAYDIFFLEQEGIIEKDTRGFPGVRFCDYDPKSFSDAKRLLGNTIGKKDNFEKLVLEDTREFWEGFPYDIYNLDFCGTCFPDKQPPFSDTFQAIERIINKHVSENHFPFIIFLTMKAFEGETNPQAKMELIQNIEANRAITYFSNQIASIIPDTQNFAAQNFADFIIISIPKIICHLADSHCDLEIKSRAKYLRSNPEIGDYFITKFVFKFSRRRQKSLSVPSMNYITNVLKILKLHNVLTIDDTLITREIKKSRHDLMIYIQQINQNPLGSQ
ncbi:hypothetical protein MUP35_01780 [Patescibacteria group bacterium]|nr:hypothetical protein [Patescibacteria group bacterium]